MRVDGFDFPRFSATTAASNGSVFHKSMTAVTWAMRSQSKRKRREAGFIKRCEARAAEREAASIKFIGRRASA